MSYRCASRIALFTFVIASGCGRAVAGRACDSTAPCPDDYVCAPARDGANRCMVTCSLTETVCHDGSACLPLGGSMGACYLGGERAINDTCTTDLDCTRTAICVHGYAPNHSTPRTLCLRGCNIDGTFDCGGGVPCVGSGYCASP